MTSEKQGIKSRFGPSNRISELAQHKTSKTIWATTPCEPVWPVSASALGTFPSARIQHLSRHKRDFSARDGPGRKDGEASCFFRKTPRPSSKTSQYECIVRLSTPRTRGRGSQDAGPRHSPQCGNNCPVWHVDPRVKTAPIAPRLLQLANPRRSHAHLQSNDQIVASSSVSSASGGGVSQRLVRLSLPRMRQSGVCCELGRPEESIWTVSRAARGATASARVDALAIPKQLSEDYVAPREPEWSRTNAPST